MIHSCVFTDELSTDFEEAIRICAELRVGYIEPRDHLFGANINKLDLAGAKRVKATIDRYGIKVGCVGSGFGKCSLTDPDEWKEHQAILERNLLFAHMWGTRVMRVFPFWIPKGVNWRTERPDLEAHLPQIVDKMGWACRRAEQEGVILGIEPEGTTFSGTLPECRRIIDAVGSKALTVAWDVANSWYYGHNPWPDEYPLVKGLVSHLHIKDAFFSPDDPTESIGHTHIDLGEIPWHDILKQLLADGYEGMASVETHLFFGHQPRFRWLQPATIDALRNLNRVLAEVQGQI